MFTLPGEVEEVLRSPASFRSLAAAARLALAIERVAEALLAEDEPVPQNGPGIVRAHEDASICPPEDRAL